MPEIPDDIMATAREVQKAIRAEGYHLNVCTRRTCSCDKFCEAKRLVIARAILAERERCLTCVDDLGGHSFYHISKEAVGDDSMVFDCALVAVHDRIRSGQ